MPEGDKKDMREFKLYCDTCKKITIFRNIDDVKTIRELIEEVHIQLYDLEEKIKKLEMRVTRLELKVRF